MMKINSIKQLQIEKEKIGKLRKQLEGRLAEDWSDLRCQMKPANILKDAICNFGFSKSKKNNASGYIFQALTNKFVNKAEDVLEKFFRKTSKKNSFK